MFKREIVDLFRSYWRTLLEASDTKAKLFVVLSIIISVSSSLAGLAGPIFLQKSVNSLTSHLFDAAIAYVGILVVCAMAEKLLQSSSGILTALSLQYTNLKLGQFYLKGIVRAPVPVVLERSTQEIVQILRSAQASSQTILSATFSQILPLVVKLVIACAILVATGDWFAVATIVVYSLLYVAYASRSTRKLASLYAYAIDSLIFSSRTLGDVVANSTVGRDFFGWRSRQPAHRHVVGPDPRPVIKKMFVLNRSTGGGRYGH